MLLTLTTTHPPATETRSPSRHTGTSDPTAFLEVTPNAEMMGVFWMPEARTIYGRQTQVTIAGEKVGDIVEIVPLV